VFLKREKKKMGLPNYEGLTKNVLLTFSNVTPMYVVLPATFDAFGVRTAFLS
tara:strand:+ start:224 stop:379 length:156 start_codon:yes stop_codon:yes gene_type:complete